jgi:branched-subunit amino acid ABC-type transport system permease component
MLLLSSRTVYATLLFVLVMILILIVKPYPLFDEKGDPAPFGVGENKENTLISLGVVTIIVAICSTFLFGMIDLVCKK